MSVFRVACGHEPALWFDTAHRVLRAFDVAEIRATLDGAQRALDDGYWIAGYLSYELGAALTGTPIRQSGWPLAAIGVFSPPETRSFDLAADAAISPLLASIGRKQYDAAIASIRRAIYDGDVYQVNYTLPFAFQFDGDPLTWWSSIARETGARYQAFVEDGDRFVCSWSPELFLAFDGERVETRPMKGTATLNALEELGSEKNRAEHVMIVDLLRNDLRRIASNVEVESLFAVERYPTFATMTSTIAGRLRNDASLFDIIRSAFPCGSVTGAPKRAAIGQIAVHESSARGVYCGSVGYLSPERRGWWNVAIRTAQLDRARETARFDAGGGIVADSSADAEWDEVLLKTRFIRSRAAAPEIWETFASDVAPSTLDAHYARLAATAERFGVEYDAHALRRAVEDMLSKSPALRLVRLRLYADGTWALFDEPMDRETGTVHVCIADERVRSDDPFLRWKTSWRPVQGRAMEQARERGCFDALLLNERGELTEGTRTNLFVELNGVLWTPPVECGLLPGILRQHLVTGGQARERVLTPADLATADALYVGNSARGLLRARILEEQS